MSDSLATLLFIEKYHKIRGDIINRAYIILKILELWPFYCSISLNKKKQIEFKIVYKKHYLIMTIINVNYLHYKIGTKGLVEGVILNRYEILNILRQFYEKASLDNTRKRICRS